MQMIAGLETFLTGAQPWIIQIAEQLHQLFDVQVSHVLHNTKETADPAYRSSQHGISLNPVKVEGIEVPPLGALNITSAMIYRQDLINGNLCPELGTLVQQPQEVVNSILATNGQCIRLADGKQFALSANMDKPLVVPVHAAVRYFAGYNEVLHVMANPEQNASVVMSMPGRVQTGYSLIHGALFNIVQHTATQLHFAEI